MSQFPLPYQTHSATSFEAAASKLSSKETEIRRVLDLLRHSAGGLTDEEMQDMLLMRGSTQRPRRIELVAMGLVKDSGVTRKTKTGRAACVWELVKE